MEKYKNFVDGAFVDADSAILVDVINPATCAVIAQVPDSSAEDVCFAVSAAKDAFPAWSRLSHSQRAVYLRRIAAKIRERVTMLAEVISREQGKVLPLATHEVNLAANYLDYVAEWALRIEGEIVSSEVPGEMILLQRKPIGVVGAILPWNFPFFLIARKVAPAILTGNTVVVKSSEETPVNAALFARILAEVELPRGVVNIISGRGGTTGSALSSHRDVGLISFTGSVSTGMSIMAAAARNLTRVNLELGGKAPAIVMNDADLDVAVKAIHESRIANTGQLCNCPERIYVQRGVLDAFTDRIAKVMAETTYGDPFGKADVMMGPLINEAALRKIDGLVSEAMAGGAEAVVGGRICRSQPGYHYEPTVLINCNSEMDIMRREIFGPVLPIQAVDDLDEAINLANASDYGLTSSIFTRDLASAMHAARELQFGETFINRNNFEAIQGFHAGRKKSGIGGTDGKHGLYAYTETHIVYMQA